MHPIRYPIDTDPKYPNPIYQVNYENKANPIPGQIPVRPQPIPNNVDPKYNYESIYEIVN